MSAPLTPEEIRHNQAMSAAALARSTEQMRSAERSHRLLVGALIAVVAIVGGFIRYGMRKQEREDAARAAGERYDGDDESEVEREVRWNQPTDAYSAGVSSYADEMCRCTDKQCARQVLAQVNAYPGHATDEPAQRSVNANMKRLQLCASAFER